jgi:hypothetical protein
MASYIGRRKFLATLGGAAGCEDLCERCQMSRAKLIWDIPKRPSLSFSLASPR